MKTQKTLAEELQAAAEHVEKARTALNGIVNALSGYGGAAYEGAAEDEIVAALDAALECAERCLTEVERLQEDYMDELADTLNGLEEEGTL